MKKKKKKIINELAIDICNKIINDYRVVYGEDHTWNVLIEFLEPQDIANLIIQRLQGK